jgi:hypothetical protein
LTSKVRKQIYIDPAQEVLLKQLSSESGIPEAELIRQAIDRHLRTQPHPRPDLWAWEKERAFLAQLIAQGPVHGGRTWRRDDLYER